MIKAIETRYAGHKFRSRLEARWAVFFDALGIKWQYEPEGFELGYRLSYSHDEDEEGPTPTFRYLPDFWLPGIEMWAEVKGHLDEEQAVRLADAAAYLSTNGGSGCHDQGGHDLVVLGPIPAEGAQRLPAKLHMHKGYLYSEPWAMRKEICVSSQDDRHIVAGDFGKSGMWDGHCARSSEGQGWQRLNRLLEGARGRPSPAVQHAYSRARQARFEHGESG